MKMIIVSPPRTNFPEPSGVRTGRSAPIVAKPLFYGRRNKYAIHLGLPREPCHEDLSSRLFPFIYLELKWRRSGRRPRAGLVDQNRWQLFALALAGPFFLPPGPIPEISIQARLMTAMPTNRGTAARLRKITYQNCIARFHETSSPFYEQQSTPRSQTRAFGTPAFGGTPDLKDRARRRHSNSQPPRGRLQRATRSASGSPSMDSR